MGWQTGQGSGSGAEPEPGPGVGSSPSQPRDPRLAGFAKDGEWEGCPPSGQLAALLDEVSGPEQRCPGATDDEIIGLLRRWAAVESWASAGKLSVIREMIRRDDGPANGCHGDLPDEWSESLRFELAPALACTTQSAEKLAWAAWQLRARLPGIGALLADGILSYAKARTVAETFEWLADGDACRAEAMILDQLAGKTYTQVENLAVKAALTVDPELAERRRKAAEKHAARIEFFREPSGTAALAGRDLPPDETLAAFGHVCARAEQYKRAAVFAKAGMDLLRAYAYLDILNGVPPETRIAAAAAEYAAAPAAGGKQARTTRPSRPAAVDPGPRDCCGAQCDGDSRPAGDEPAGQEPVGNWSVGNWSVGNRSDGPGGRTDNDGDDSDSDGGDPGDDGPAEGGPAGGGGGRGGGPSPAPAPAGPGAAGSVPPAVPPRPVDLVIPLASLLKRANRPGEAHALGLIDPGLARALAATAARSPLSEWCLTVTSPEGYAIGHGCFRRARAGPQGKTSPADSSPGSPGPADMPLAALPARVNLTVPATLLSGLAGDPGAAAANAPPWRFTPLDRPPPADERKTRGYGNWRLILPDGREFTVRTEPVPTHSCDHRHESFAYQPNAALRHLVQVRDGTCTFPPCGRHARDADFEHAVPYHQGGRTCACNAGARSRQCHRIKQSKNWNVTQPRPGWHQWTTPAGRVYTQEPKRYPA
jgi:uncharacterized protein DUF222